MKRHLYAAIGSLSLLTGACAAVPDLIQPFDHPDQPLEAIDRSGGGRNLKLTADSTISGAQPRFGTGNLLIRAGVRAATAGWYLPLKSMPEFSGEIEAMTITFWVRPEQSGAIPFIRRSQFSGEAGVFGFQLDRYDSMVFSVGKERVKSPPTGLQPGEWTHLAVTFDRGTVVFYVNGELTATESLRAEPIAASSIEGAFSAFLNAPVGLQVDDFGFFGSRALNGEAMKKICTDGLEAFLGNASAKAAKRPQKR